MTPAEIDDRVRQSRENARRLRIVSINELDVLGWFADALSGWAGVRALSLPEIGGLPAGAVVLAVHADHLRRVFDFTVGHPSFDPVPDGDPIPPFPGPLRQWRRVIELPRGDEPTPAVVVG